MSLVVADNRDMLHFSHLRETPGHTNFQDEVVSAIALADGVECFAGAVVGLTVLKERTANHAGRGLMSFG